MMHQSNYFQKATVVFVVTILLIIPNLSVYSFVGQYQISSLAITVNNHFIGINEYSLNMPAIASVALTGGIIIISLALTAAFMDENYGYSSVNRYSSNDFSDYIKYDFSEFDN